MMRPNDQGETVMRRARLMAAVLAVVGAVIMSGAPASADTCGPKAVCVVYRTACAVAYEAGLQCVD